MRGVDLHAAEGVDVSRLRPAAAAQHAADAGNQFPEPKGLGDIVVRPHVQAHDDVTLVIPGGEKDNGGTVVFGFDGPADVVTRAVGEGQIQYRQVEPLRLQPFQSGADGGTDHGFEALLAQRIFQSHGDALVILHQQQLFRFHDGFCPFRSVLFL